MTTIAIMQPTYLPWAGYFNLISMSEHFIFLDDVKIEKQSWQVRNKILSNNKEHLITLPIEGSRNQLINQVPLNTKLNWRKKHTSLLEQTYLKHPYGKDCLECILPIINSDILSLADLNISIITALSAKLGFNSNFHRSSGFNISGERSNRLISICRSLSSKNYLSPNGAREYIEQDGDFAKTDITVTFQNFLPPSYPHKSHHEFLPYLSIIDMICNIGFSRTSELIKNK